MSSTQMSRRTQSKPVSRLSGPRQRSLFSRPENSEQQEYAFARQAGNYRHAANQVNPLKSNANRAHGQRRRGHLSSAFGGNQVPGQTQVRQPNSRMINPQTGRNQYRPRQQRGTMSMSQMNDFIRRQPGGKSFMEESDRMYGGRFNFDQSLSRTGAGMAQRNGALPPELQQMAIPFSPSKKAEKSRIEREQAWQQQQQRSQAQRKPRTWYESKQAQAISQMVAQEHHETQQRYSRRTQDAEMAEAMSLGIRYQPTNNRPRQSQAQQQQPQQQQQQQPQQQPRKRPPQVRAPSRVQRRPQGEQSVGRDPSRYESETLNQRLREMDIEEQRGSGMTAETYGTRTERPSRLFAQNVSGIQRSVNHTMYVNQNEDDSESALPVLAVSGTRQKSLEKEERMVELNDEQQKLSLIELEKLRIKELQEQEEKRRIAILKATGRGDVLQREAERAALAEEYDNAPKEGQVEFIETVDEEQKNMSPIELEQARLQKLREQQDEHRWKVLQQTGRADQVRQVEQRHQEEVAPARRVRFADEQPDQYYTDEQHLRQEDDMMPEQQFQ